jgi:hypothetical protein
MRRAPRDYNLRYGERGATLDDRVSANHLSSGPRTSTASFGSGTWANGSTREFRRFLPCGLARETQRGVLTATEQ